MTPDLALLAQAASQDGGASPGSIFVIGFSFVIVVLALIAIITSAIGAYFTRQAAQEARKAAEASQRAAEQLAARGVGVGGVASATATASTGEVAQASPQSSSGLIDPRQQPELVAVIAAAIHCMVGHRPHRLVSIRTSDVGWAQEGRRAIFSSHQTR